MTTNLGSPWLKAVVAATAIFSAADHAHGATYYLTGIRAHVAAPADPAITVRTTTDPISMVVVSNASNRPQRCWLDFSTGGVPAGSDSRTVAPHRLWIARSPVAGPVGIVDVGVKCG